MSFVKWIFFFGVLAQAAVASASTETTGKTLRVYGPGGPHHVLSECAELFSKRNGVNVAVIKALPYDLERKLAEDGDIYYGGAEYMLDDFNRKNPGVLNLSTVDVLHARRIGIIVRKNNPHKIKSIDCLSREGVDLLDVKLERMRHFYNNPKDQLRNVRRLEFTGRQGLSAWLNSPDLDAWVTYKSWHTLISDHAEFIEIPGQESLRYTPVALTHRTPYEQDAMEFINFLKSDEARLIFAEHGWEAHHTE